MKKTIPALMLILALTLSLSACGGPSTQSAAPAAAQTTAAQAHAAKAEAAPAPEPTPEPTPSPEPTPERLYVRRVQELLVQKRVCGQAAEADLPRGRVFDAVTDYVYDAYGAPVSETTRYEHTSLRNEYYSDDVEFLYDDAGQIVGETATRPSYGLDRTWRFDYDDQGFCTHWSYSWDTIGSAEADFSYDDDGRLCFASVTVNGEGAQTMTPVYEDGRQVATKHVAPDGGEVEQRFLYDEQGRLCAVEYDAAEAHEQANFFIVDYPHNEFRYNPYKAGDRHVEIVFTYADDDLITEATWKVDGKTLGVTQYSYPASKNEEGAIAHSQKAEGRGPFLWDSIFSDPWDRYDVLLTKWGSPSFVRRSDMTVLGDRPYYADSVIDYEYEERYVLLEVEPGDVDSAVTLEQLYPALGQTLCGEAVPQPDGTKQLVRVEMAGPIPTVAEPVFREDGSFAGVVSRFDGQAAYRSAFWHKDVETDEQGRLISDPESKARFTWGEDGKSYTYAWDQNDPSEYRLENSLIQDRVKRLLAKRDSWEYNEDGLPSKTVTRYASGEERTAEYSYSWQSGVKHPYDWKQENCTVLFSNNGSYESPVLIFDEHGYLVYLNLPSSSTFSYTYEDLA